MRASTVFARVVDIDKSLVRTALELLALSLVFVDRAQVVVFRALSEAVPARFCSGALGRFYNALRRLVNQLVVMALSLILMIVSLTLVVPPYAFIRLCPHTDRKL